MHRLLHRQLRRFLAREDPPDELRKLLEAVSDAYSQADDDRRLLERSLELTSQELLQRNRDLRADIDARQRAEEQTRAILAGLPDLLLVLSPAGMLLEVHAPRPSFLPGDASALVGRQLAEVLPPEAHDALAPAVRRVALSRELQRLELRLGQGNDARYYEARLTVSAAGDVVALIRDQTERLQLAERLRVADRMASVGTLAAGVAHELNNPLAYVLGNLELLRQELRALSQAPADLGVMVQEALEGARRMRAITQDLRTFSQPHAEVVEAVDPREIVDSALKMAATEVRHRASLRREYGEVPAVRAEAGKLGQVFLNLIVNAVQCLPVGEASRNEIIIRTSTSASGDAIVDVSDTGPGIPAHLHSRIFEPFVTTKPRDVGTGLGLSICHNIVTSLGGRISAHRRAPRGTTFRVRLPASREPVVKRHSSTGRLPAISNADGPVLIIDDDPMVAATIQRLLDGREVIIAGSGREGIEVLDRSIEFDVVLCDLMMPEVSGMDVYDTIAGRDPELAARFIFMTGGAFTDRARRFLDQVSNPRLEKPFDAKTLRTVVSSHGGGAE